MSLLSSVVVYLPIHTLPPDLHDVDSIAHVSSSSPSPPCTHLTHLVTASTIGPLRATRHQICGNEYMDGHISLDAFFHVKEEIRFHQAGPVRSCWRCFSLHLTLLSCSCATCLAQRRSAPLSCLDISQRVGSRERTNLRTNRTLAVADP